MDSAFALFLAKRLPRPCVRGWTVRVLTEFVYGLVSNDDEGDNDPESVYITVLAAGSHHTLVDSVKFKRTATVQDVKHQACGNLEDAENALLFRENDTQLREPITELQFDGLSNNTTFVLVKRPGWNTLRVVLPDYHRIAWNPVHNHVFATLVSVTDHAMEVTFRTLDGKQWMEPILVDYVLKDHEVHLYWHPDGVHIAVGNPAGGSMIWNSSTREHISIYPCMFSHMREFWNCAGTMFAIFSGAQVEFYKFNGNPISMTNLGFTHICNHSSSGWHPTEQWFYTTVDNSLYIIDTTKPVPCHVILGDGHVLTTPHGNIDTCAWSHDGKRLVVVAKADHGGAVNVYDAATYTPIYTFNTTCLSGDEVVWHPTYPNIFAIVPFFTEFIEFVYLDTAPRNGTETSQITKAVHSKIVYGDGDSICSVCWNPEGTLLCVVEFDTISIFSST